MKSRRGFANPEYMIALTLILVFLAVVIPACQRVRAKRGGSPAPIPATQAR